MFNTPLLRSIVFITDTDKNILVKMEFDDPDPAKSTINIILHVEGIYKMYINSNHLASQMNVAPKEVTGRIKSIEYLGSNPSITLDTSTLMNGSMSTFSVGEIAYVEEVVV